VSIDDKIRKSIEAQFVANKRKNLFFKHIDRETHFQPETQDIIRNHKEELEQIENLNLSDKWIDLMTNMALQTFYASNQFIDFNQVQIDELRQIYRTLWKEIINEIRTGANYKIIQKAHLERLSTWLIRSNAFTREINGDEYPEVVNVVCAEYSALLQIKLLQIDVSNIVEPILDIGCGENAWLVKYLRELGVDAYGVDRLFNSTENYLYRANWLEFEFKPQRWGTIVSNLSFALHFTNHHQRKDGNYHAYAKKYMEILGSLKTNGSFHYAPSLPFIESFLPRDKFRISTERINKEFSNTIVYKII
jgi:hypothetical protein